MLIGTLLRLFSIIILAVLVIILVVVVGLFVYDIGSRVNTDDAVKLAISRTERCLPI